MEYMLDQNEINYLINASENPPKIDDKVSEQRYTSTYTKKESIELINSNTFGEKV